MTAFKIIRVLLGAVALPTAFLEVLYFMYIIKWRKQGKTLESACGKIFSKKKVIILCQILLVLEVLSSPLVFGKFQNTNIGSFFEKEAYEEQYYVYIRSDNQRSKSYRCKADIYRGDYGYAKYTDNGEEIFIIQGNGYFLKKLYWSNGGYLIFADDDLPETASSARIYPGKEAAVIDYHNNKYYVTLTTEKVSKPQKD